MARVMVVTGAFGTLGRATVAALAAAGHRVAAVDLAPEPADHGAARAFGGVDLADPIAVAAAYADIAAALGPIDGLANIAGGFAWETIAEGSIATFERMFAINTRTAAISCAAALPHLTAAGAAIVNVGAASADPAATGMAPYAASKAGVKALTQSLADELRPRRIRVNMVQPTTIDTPDNRRDMPDADPAGWVTAAEAADVVAFLLSPAAAAVTGAAILLSR